MKKVLVVGLGISGIGSVKLLNGKAEVSVYDAKTEDQINENDLKLLKDLGVKTFFAVEPDEDYDELVLCPAVPLTNPIVEKYSKKGASIIGELELAYRYCKGQFIAITGTNGKTTTTTLAGEIFKTASKNCIVAGNIGKAVSECCESAEAGTEMITEVSSFQLETIKEFHPHISVIINLTPDHLDRHGSFEGYIAAKARVTENQNENDYFIYNSSDPETKKLADTITNVKKIPFSAREEGESLALLDDSAFISDGKLVVKKEGTAHVLCDCSALQIPGKHNLENALAASAIAVFSGVADKFIIKTLKQFKGVEHRLEFVRELKGVRFINDSKGTNPDAAIKAIEAISAPILLIAGGYDKHLEFEDFIKAFDGKVAYLILLGDTAEQIKKTAIECGFEDAKIVKCNSLSACVASAAKLAERGDTVLLSPACASWDMFENFEQRGEEFKKFVKAL